MLENVVVGSIVEGKVTKITPFGAIVSIGNGVQGLVHISQIANTFVQDINDHVAVGDMVKVKILSVDETTKRISLSIRAALPPAPKPQKNYQNNRSYDQKPASDRPNDSFFGSSSSSNSDFEDKMKEFLKQANEKQAGLNKRANKRY